MVRGMKAGGTIAAARGRPPRAAANDDHGDPNARHIRTPAGSIPARETSVHSSPKKTPKSPKPQGGQRTAQQRTGTATSEGGTNKPKPNKGVTTAHAWSEQVGNAESTRASSPAPTPVTAEARPQIRTRRGATKNSGGRRATRHRRGGTPSQPGGSEDAATQSKVQTLEVAPDKLGTSRPGYVRIKLISERLRVLAAELFRGHQPNKPNLQPERPSEEEAAKMAPVREKQPRDLLEDHLKTTIQTLYEFGSIVHGYQDRSHQPLVQKGITLTHSLFTLSALTADNSTHPSASRIRSIRLPPEVIEYVSNGRNPDIYTREFVENVQRGNQVLNGKMEAFGSFAEILARETKSAIPELAGDMDRVMEMSGGFEQERGKWRMKNSSKKEGREEEGYKNDGRGGDGDGWDGGNGNGNGNENGTKRGDGANLAQEGGGGVIRGETSNGVV